MGRGIASAFRQIDHLSGVDQAGILDLWVDRQDIPPAHADSGRNFSERISRLYDIIAGGWWVVARVIAGT